LTPIRISEGVSCEEPNLQGEMSPHLKVNLTSQSNWNSNWFRCFMQNKRSKSTPIRLSEGVSCEESNLQGESIPRLKVDLTSLSDSTSYAFASWLESHPFFVDQKSQSLRPAGRVLPSLLIGRVESLLSDLSTLIVFILCSEEPSLCCPMIWRVRLFLSCTI